MTSLCGFSSSDHDSCGVNGFLMELLRDPYADIPSNSADAELSMTKPVKSHSFASAILY